MGAFRTTLEAKIDPISRFLDPEWLVWRKIDPPKIGLRTSHFAPELKQQGRRTAIDARAHPPGGHLWRSLLSAEGPVEGSVMRKDTYGTVPRR